MNKSSRPSGHWSLCLHCGGSIYTLGIGSATDQGLFFWKLVFKSFFFSLDPTLLTGQPDEAPELRNYVIICPLRGLVCTHHTEAQGGQVTQWAKYHI